MLGCVDCAGVVGVGGDTNENPPVAGVESKGHIVGLKAGLFQNRDDIGFADARCADRADEFGAGVGKVILEPRDNFIVQDGIEFAGRAGQDKQDSMVGKLDALTGGGTDGVGQNGGAFQHEGLPGCGEGNVPVAGFVPRLQIFHGGLVDHDFPAEPFGEGIAGEVVGRRAEAAADEDERGAGQRFIDSASNDGDLVGNGGIADELQADGGQRRAEILRVRIQRLSAKQFVADRNEFCLIVHPVLLKVCGHIEAMKESNQSLSVDACGQRLDVFLAAAVSAVSRSHWKTLIQAGHVTVDGKGCKPNHTLKAGDTVCWTLPEEAPAEPRPENIPLDILFEDAAVLVLNKPAGLVVHPAAGNETGTLVNALLFHDPVFQSVERAGMVHRLDKDTSGAMVIAKTAAAMVELQRQFKARETEKEYLALVWGAPPANGRIETLIGRHPVHRKKMAVLKEGGRVAVSNFEAQESFAETTLLHVRIETGRTHQIRVHMAHLGHPIVGDTVYGRARKNKLPAKVERQMLHAARLGFTHPDTGKRLSFAAPLPNDMRRLLENLRNEDNG